NALDHSATIAGIEALFGIRDGAATLDSVIVSRLAGARSYTLPAAAEVEDHGDIDSVVEMIQGLPDGCRRRRCIAFAKPIPLDGWRRAAFPTFGLYNFTANDRFITFRCAGRPSPAAPLGHTHDDNLAIDYMLGGECRIDPGSFCYTP